MSLTSRTNNRSIAKGCSYGGNAVKAAFAGTQQSCNCRVLTTKCRVNVKVNKIWIDDGNAYATRPNSLEIALKRDGDDYKKATLTADTGWAHTFVCLPVWKNTQEKHVYTVDETTTPDGYTKSVNGFNITNTLDEITINGSKIWNDNHNADSKRPASIIVNLMQNGSQFDTLDLASPVGQDVVPFKFENLPFTDEQGTPYNYTIDEGTIAGYSKAISGFNITNTLITRGFSFAKTSAATGFSLQGAVFEIRQYGVPVMSSMSDMQGKVAFSGLLPGTYQMAETQPPAGYMNNPDIYEVVVSEDSVTIDGLPYADFSVKNTPKPAEIILRRATAAEPAYMDAPNTWPLHGNVSPDLYMFDKIIITLTYPAVSVKWAYGAQDEDYFRNGGGIDITADYQNGIHAPLNTDYTVYALFNDGTDTAAHISIDRLRDGSKEMPFLLLDFSTADALEPLIPGIKEFNLYYMQGNGIKLTQHYEIYETIDMASRTWEPIAPLDMTQFFTGSLYGNGNEIKNMVIGTSYEYVYRGMFRFLGDGASVQSLKLVNCSVEDYYIASGFAAYVIIEQGGEVLLKDLSFEGTLNARICGGIAGILVARNGSLVVDGCISKTDIEEMLDSSYGAGIAGSAFVEENGILSVINCQAYGSASLKTDSSGILGELECNGFTEISNCYNAMTVGIGSQNSGGGIIGRTTGAGTAVISSCYNQGEINAGNCGGIMGSINLSATADFKLLNCYNSGSVHSSMISGGITGSIEGPFTIQNCYNTGDIYSTNYVGGVAGNYGTVENCAALNQTVSATSLAALAARISSINNLSVHALNNNIAFDGMQVLINGVPKSPLDIGSSGTDGISTSAAEIKTQSLYQDGLGWNFADVWIFGNGAYTLPVLRGIPISLQPAVLPPHL